MITAVDTSVLLDVFLADPTFGPVSADALRRCLATGSLIACDVVWAEIGAALGRRHAREGMERLAVGYSALDMVQSLAAGEAWRRYRDRGGSRSRVLPDFLIGAHARAAGDRLLTRDRGFFRAYFASLDVLDPSES